MSMSQLWGNIRFIGRVLRDLLRHIFCAALLLSACSGCMNLWTRSGKPYACAPYLYYCTAEAWTDCVCAPFQRGSSNDPIWTSFATLTWPFWVVDEVAEAALDTVFLPVDGIYALYKDRPQQPQGESEIIQEAK